MNPNDILAQQQALMNQYAQNMQHVQIGMLALSLAGLIITAGVIYMFYACLRRIEDEIRIFRIAYEFDHPPQQRSSSRQAHRNEIARLEPTKPLVPVPAEQKFMPKP